MQKIIGVTELQRRFRSVFDEVAHDHIPYILTRGSRPEAALISYEEYVQYQAFKEEAIKARFDELLARMAKRNADVDEDELNSDIDTAREAIHL